MTCSKIFSGDLPEITNYIIQYLHHDYGTLYSCVLVNRLWCRLTIPLLWEDPFSIPIKNYKLIEIYLRCSNEVIKAKLREYDIIDDSIHSNTLFNYPKFIKYLDTSKITLFISKCKGQNLYYSIQGAFDINRLIYKSLFEMFIKNEASVHTFSVMVTFQKSSEYFNDILELISQNS